MNVQDASTKLTELSISLMQREKEQSQTLESLIEVNAALKQRDLSRESLQALIEMINRLIIEGHPLYLQELHRVLETGLEMPIVRLAAPDFLDKLLLRLNSVDTSAIQTADLSLALISSKSYNEEIIPKLVVFHDKNPDLRAYTAKYMKNILNSLTSLNSYSKQLLKFIDLSVLESSGDVKFIGIEVCKIVRDKFPNLVKLSKEVMQEIKKRNKSHKVFLRRRKIYKSDTAPVSFIAQSEQTNLSLIRIGIDLDRLHSNVIPDKIDELEHFLNRISDCSERKKICETTDKDTLFHTLIELLNDTEISVQFFALESLHMIIADKQYTVNVRHLLDKLVSVHEDCLDRAHELMNLLIMVTFTNEPYVFIEYALRPGFEKRFLGVTDLLLDLLSLNPLTQILLANEGGVSLLLSMDTNNGFTMQTLFLLLQYGISSQELHKLLMVLKEMGHLTGTLMRLAQSCTFMSIEHEKYVDYPTSYFMINSETFMRFPPIDSKKNFSLYFWFAPKLHRETVPFFEINGKKQSLQIVLEDSDLLIKHGKKTPDYLTGVLQLDSWNSFMISFKNSRGLLTKKLECCVYCNGKYKNLSLSDQYDFSCIGIGSLNRDKQGFEGLVSLITCFEDYIPGNIGKVVATDWNDEFSFIKKSSFQSCSKLTNSSSFPAILYQIDPSEPQAQTKTSQLNSLAGAFKGIGGLGTLFPLLKNFNHVDEVLETLSLFSRSLFFESLLFPHFFEYLGIILSRQRNLQAEKILYLIETFKENIPGKASEVLEGLLLNKKLWKNIQISSLTSCVEKFICNLNCLENPSLMKLYSSFSLVFEEESLIQLIIASLKIIKDKTEMEKSLYILLCKLQEDIDKLNIFRSLLGEIELYGFSLKFRNKLVNLLPFIEDEATELNLLKVAFPHIKTQKVYFNFENSRIETGKKADPEEKAIIESIQRKLNPNRIFKDSFSFILDKFHPNKENNSILLSILTSRLCKNSETLVFLTEIKEIIFKNPGLGQKFLSVDYPNWISDIYIANYMTNSDVISEIFTFFLSCFPDTLKAKHLEKIKNFLKRILYQGPALYDFYQYMFENIDFSRKKLCFLGLISIFEELVSIDGHLVVKENIERYSEILRQITAIGEKCQFFTCSRPVTPHIPLDLLLQNKHSKVFSDKVCIREGGFIRITIRLNLIGLVFQQSQVFTDNMLKIFGGANSLFNAYSVNSFVYKSTTWDEITGYASEYPEGKDLFFHPEWICTYILTEAIEILFPKEISMQNPLVVFLMKLWKEIDIFKSEIFRISFTSESEINCLNRLASTDYSFASTIQARNGELQNVIEQRKREIFTYSYALDELENDLRSLNAKITQIGNNFEGVMKLLLYEDDYFYIKRVHVYLLTVICGRLQLFYDFSLRNEEEFQPNENLVSMEKPVVKDEAEYILYEMYIEHSYRKYKKIVKSFIETPEPGELIQVRNRFDVLGRRCLLKPLSKKTNAPDKWDSYIPGNRICDCEQIKVEGNYFGSLSITKNYFFFQSSDNFDRDYKGAAPDIARICYFKRVLYSTKDIEKIFPKRYLLQHTGVEIQLKSGKNLFFNLFTQENRDSFCEFASSSWNVGVLTTDHIKSSADFYCKQWQNNEISNFEYLMHLNGLASRSSLDITQYPIFPCLISSYESPELRIEDPSSYRLFEYPIGAQTVGMREESAFKFNMWDDESIRPFHYGTHYSSGGVTAHYLFRLEPFTSQAKNIQGGALDAGDRLFLSMKSAWHSSQSSIGDVKELVPELFYLPELSLNRTGEAFALKQDKSPVSELELPIWASSPFEFILKHSLALESSYVRDKIRHWIDLVFGYKQTGSIAVNAHNVFYETCYENYFNASLQESTDEEAEKLVSFVFNFGQTPVKLFTKEHPKPFRSESVLTNNLESVQVHGNIIQFTQNGKEIYGISAHSGQIALNKIEVYRGVASLSPVTQLAKMKRSLLENSENVSCFCVFMQHFISGCHFDNSFKMYRLDGKYVRSVYYHSTIVSAVVSTANYLFTASVDSLMVAWVISHKELQVFHTYRGHKSAILAIAPLENYCMVASLSQESSVLIHEMRTGECLRKLTPDNIVSISPVEFGFFLIVCHNEIIAVNANGYQEKLNCSQHGRISYAGTFRNLVLIRNEAGMFVYKLFQNDYTLSVISTNITTGCIQFSDNKGTLLCGIKPIIN